MTINSFSKHSSKWKLFLKSFHTRRITHRDHIQQTWFSVSTLGSSSSGRKKNLAIYLIYSTFFLYENFYHNFLSSLSLLPVPWNGKGMYSTLALTRRTHAHCAYVKYKLPHTYKYFLLFHFARTVDFSSDTSVSIHITSIHKMLPLHLISNNFTYYFAYKHILLWRKELKTSIQINFKKYLDKKIRHISNSEVVSTHHKGDKGLTFPY